MAFKKIRSSLTTDWFESFGTWTLWYNVANSKQKWHSPLVDGFLFSSSSSAFKPANWITDIWLDIGYKSKFISRRSTIFSIFQPLATNLWRRLALNTSQIKSYFRKQSTKAYHWNWLCSAPSRRQSKFYLYFPRTSTNIRKCSLQYLCLHVPEGVRWCYGQPSGSLRMAWKEEHTKPRHSRFFLLSWTSVSTV